MLWGVKGYYRVNMTATFTVKIKDQRGRVYIPIEIRECEGIKPGDFIKVDVEKVTRNKK
jgi:bifunctional DNA-binding transcriptional regulator/antitoxin component of YhaV-PrlF toxin-antitoxin module